MTAIQAFADTAASAVEEMIEMVPGELQERMARALESGCSLSIAVTATADEAPEIGLDIVGETIGRLRLVTVPGQRHSQH